MNIKDIIFDVDGVLIEADGATRHEKYANLFKWGLELVNLREYGGSSWMFEQLKRKYDEGIAINSNFYILINPKTPEILAKLSERFSLYACSVACNSITLDKLKATKIDKYFKGIYLKPLRLYDKATAIVDDRFIDYGDCFFIKFNHGQYNNQSGEADLIIANIEELLTAM